MCHIYEKSQVGMGLWSPPKGRKVDSEPVLDCCPDDGEGDGSVTLDGHLLGIRLDLTPGDCLTDLCSGEGSVELLCGGEVDTVV